MSPKPKPDSTSTSTSKPTNTTHKGAAEKVADASSSRTPVPSATANVSPETDAAVRVAGGAKDASSLGPPVSTATHDQVADVSATTATASKVADGTKDASSLGTPVSTATRDQVVNVSATTATASKVAADAKDASSALAPPALLDQTANDPADNAVPPMATIDSQGSSSSILEDLKKKLLYIETGKARLLKKSLAMEVARQEGERQIEYKKQCMVREMQDMEKKHQEQREAEEKVRAALEKYMQGELQKRKELHLRRDAQLSVSSQQMEKEKRELEMDNGLFLRTLSQTVNLVGDQIRYDDTKKMDRIKEVSTTTMQDFVDFVATAVKMKRTGMEDEEQMLKEHERDQQDKELKTEKKEKKKRRGVEKEVEKAVEEELKKKREEMMQKLEELENERKGRMQKQQEELEKEHKERVRKQQEELEKERKERMRKQQEELEKEHKERMRKQQEELEKERKERMRKQQEELEKEHKEGMRKQQEELEKERKERVQAMVQERMQEWAQERMQTVRSDHAQELQELQNRHKEVMAKLFDDNWEKLMRDLGLREAEELSTNDQNVDGTLAPGDQSRSLGNPEAGESARDASKPEGQSDERVEPSSTAETESKEA